MAQICFFWHQLKGVSMASRPKIENRKVVGEFAVFREEKNIREWNFNPPDSRSMDFPCFRFNSISQLCVPRLVSSVLHFAPCFKSYSADCYGISVTHAGSIAAIVQQLFLFFFVDKQENVAERKFFCIKFDIKICVSWKILIAQVSVMQLGIVGWNVYGQSWHSTEKCSRRLRNGFIATVRNVYLKSRKRLRAGQWPNENENEEARRVGNPQSRSSTVSQRWVIQFMWSGSARVASWTMMINCENDILRSLLKHLEDWFIRCRKTTLTHKLVNYVQLIKLTRHVLTFPRWLFPFWVVNRNIATRFAEIFPKYFADDGDNFLQPCRNDSRIEILFIRRQFFALSTSIKFRMETSRE